MGITQVRPALAGLALSLFAAASAVAAPTISSFTPASGTIANKVTITGSGFSSVTAVKFNGVLATYTVSSTTQIVAIVPNAAWTGPITVTAGGATVASATSFTVTPGMALSFATGHPLQQPTLSGAGFHASTGVDLFFDNQDVALFVTSPTGTLSTGYQIPVSAQPGAHWITFVERVSGWAAQKAFTVQTDWADSAFGPMGRGFNPYENTINTGNVSTLTAAWSGNMGISGLLPYIVSGGSVFVADVTGKIHAFSKTGALLWTAPSGGDQHVNPAAGAGHVFFADANGDVASFSPTCRSDGGVCTPQWTANIAASVTAGLTFYNGTLYAPSGDGSIHTLNPATGAQGTPIFAADTTHGPVTTPVSFDTDGSFYYAAGTTLEYSITGRLSSFKTYNGFLSPIAVTNGAAFFTTGDGMVHRFGSNGWIWDVATSGTGCAPAPVVALGMVFAGGCSTLAAYSPINGANVLWSNPTLQITGIAEANGVLYACDGAIGNANVVGYDAHSGGYLWTGGVCASAPEITNGNVFATSTNLNAYDFPTTVGNVRQAPAISSLNPDYSLKPQLSGTPVASLTPPGLSIQ